MPLNVRNEPEDHLIKEWANKGGYSLQVVARLSGEEITNVRYLIRLRDPARKYPIDYMASLETFRDFGCFMLALSRFAKLPYTRTHGNE